MATWVSAFRMEVDRFSRPLRAVGELPMPNARLDTTRPIECVCEMPPGAGVLRLLVPGMSVGVMSICRCVADWVEVTD
jgi:hypothetical protein